MQEEQSDELTPADQGNGRGTSKRQEHTPQSSACSTEIAQTRHIDSHRRVEAGDAGRVQEEGRPHRRPTQWLDASSGAFVEDCTRTPAPPEVQAARRALVMAKDDLAALGIPEDELRAHHGRDHPPQKFRTGARPCKLLFEGTTARHTLPQDPSNHIGRYRTRGRKCTSPKTDRSTSTSARNRTRRRCHFRVTAAHAELVAVPCVVGRHRRGGRQPGRHERLRQGGSRRDARRRGADVCHGWVELR